VLKVLVAALVLCAVQAVSPACTIVLQRTAVGSNFHVRVMDREQPVAGLAVILSARLVVKHRAVTDHNGVARFTAIPGGVYYASPDHPARYWSEAMVEVSPDNSSEVIVPIQWPSRKPAVARTVGGIMRMSSWEMIPQPNLKLELLEHMSGRVLHESQTDENGAFRFPNMAPGFYFLRIQFSSPNDFDFIPVEVKPEADFGALRLALGSTSCGMFFANLNECPQADLRLARLSGSVADASDGVIAEAAIALVDQAGNEVQRTRSDSMGRFGPLQVAAGRYELRIVRAGFTLLETPVTIDPQGDQGPLAVKLGLMGACSTAKLR